MTYYGNDFMEEKRFNTALSWIRSNLTIAGMLPFQDMTSLQFIEYWDIVKQTAKNFSVDAGELGRAFMREQGYTSPDPFLDPSKVRIPEEKMWDSTEENEIEKTRKFLEDTRPPDTVKNVGLPVMAIALAAGAWWLSK